MDNCFFDLPLKRDLYTAYQETEQVNPVRLFITEPNSKIAFNLIHELLRERVLGDNQGIILHTSPKKDKYEYKNVFLNFPGEGFHLLEDIVVSSKPEIAYKGISVAVIILAPHVSTTKSSKHVLAKALFSTRCVARNIVKFGAQNCRIIVTGPSTKLNLLALMLINQLEPSLGEKNLTAMTVLDEFIARSHLAAKIYSTTDRIKNVNIWGLTCPDTYYTTFEKEWSTNFRDVPIQVMIPDTYWLRSDFESSITKRNLKNEGSIAVTKATLTHIIALFNNNQNQEIISMGVITPKGNLFHFREGLALSFPVRVQNGQWEIEDMQLRKGTELHLMNLVHTLEGDNYLNIYEIINVLKKEDRTPQGAMAARKNIEKVMSLEKWRISWYLSENLGLETPPACPCDETEVEDEIPTDD